MFGFEDTELFTCCVCRQGFATEQPAPGAPDLRPVSLPCGHAICARCGVEGQRRETGCPLRCAWRGSDIMCPRQWPLAYHYMQDIAAARALLPWLPAAAAEAMGVAEPCPAAAAERGAPADLQRAPTLQRPQLGGNLSQHVFVDSPAMGESSHVHTIKVVLSCAAVATLHGIVCSRFLQSCARADTLTSASDADDTATRCGGGDRAADSAAAAYFRHPASAEAELEAALRATLLDLQAPYSALTRAVVTDIAELVLRALYGAGAEFATAVRFAGHHAAVLQVRLTWSPSSHLWSHELALQLGGARSHLRSLADVDAAHACGLFEGRALDLPAPPAVPTPPRCAAAACGGGGGVEGGESKGAGKTCKADSVDMEAVAKHVVTRARSASRRSPRSGGGDAGEAQLGRGKRRRVPRVLD